MDYEKKKVVWIDKDVHKSLKDHCESNGLKIKFVVEQAIKNQIKKNG